MIPSINLDRKKYWLTLLNLGDGEAIGVRGSLAYRGRALFKLKDRIDRKFVAASSLGSLDPEKRCVVKVVQRNCPVTH